MTFKSYCIKQLSIQKVFFLKEQIQNEMEKCFFKILNGFFPRSSLTLKQHKENQTCKHTITIKKLERISFKNNKQTNNTTTQKSSF